LILPTFCFKSFDLNFRALAFDSRNAITHMENECNDHAISL
jgi:hypothetical protein